MFKGGAVEKPQASRATLMVHDERYSRTRRSTVWTVRTPMRISGPSRVMERTVVRTVRAAAHACTTFESAVRATAIPVRSDLT
jgi:hypothetical protein